MTVQEAIDEIRQQLLEPVAGFWSDAELINHIKRAELDFSNKVRGFESMAFLSLQAGRPDYPLPSNWLSARAIFVNTKETDSDPDSWKPLSPTNLERMKLESPNFMSGDSSTFGVPLQYWIWDRAIRFQPTPDANGTNNVVMFFKAKPTPVSQLTDSLTVDDSLCPGIVAYVLWKAWTKEKELEFANEQQQIYREYVAEGRRFVKKQSGDQVYRIDNISSEPFSF